MTQLDAWPEGIPGKPVHPRSLVPPLEVLWLFVPVVAMLPSMAVGAFGLEGRIGLFCLAAGLGSLVTGWAVRRAVAGLAASVAPRRDRLAPAQATVVRTIPSPKPLLEVASALVEFTAGDRTHQAVLGGNAKAAGTTVDVLYDPAEPAWVINAGSAGDPGGAKALRQVAVLFAAMGVCLLLVAALDLTTGL